MPGSLALLQSFIKQVRSNVSYTMLSLPRQQMSLEKARLALAAAQSPLVDDQRALERWLLDRHSR